MLELTAHPAQPCDDLRVSASAERGPGGAISLRWRVEGPVETIVWPPAATGRANELWRTTCFEAFVAPAGGEGYVEINRSPSGAWNVYQFDGPRAGMREVAVIGTAFSAAPGNTHAEYGFATRLPGLSEGDWQLGLTAVVERTDGRVHHFALSHGAERPDFHDRACFTLALAAPASA